ncbi:MAG: hypothetical protein HS132_14020 [Planctomycetia bacterium]|nr:hypothetical protein [Planctomycetia bacterium]
MIDVATANCRNKRAIAMLTKKSVFCRHTRISTNKRQFIRITLLTRHVHRKKMSGDRGKHANRLGPKAIQNSYLQAIRSPGLWNYHGGVNFGPTVDHYGYAPAKRKQATK